MAEIHQSVRAGFSWLIPPILNHFTRVAFVANAATGLLMAQGWESDGPATQIFTLNEAQTG